eukprot:TRINITY_DN9110_c0_g1_i1.p1 TRINITY_DN9110_c0_g1~~TRINITY_DN9110_c0_g1_i1.p1  ORF type:complete len:155 (+),score=36.14 TRINITY_DN9110_c0_g1_i1:318-782(+)
MDSDYRRGNKSSHISIHSIVLSIGVAVILLSIAFPWNKQGIESELKIYTLYDSSSFNMVVASLVASLVLLVLEVSDIVLVIKGWEKVVVAGIVQGFLFTSVLVWKDPNDNPERLTRWLKNSYGWKLAIVGVVYWFFVISYLTARSLPSKRAKRH